MRAAAALSPSWIAGVVLFLFASRPAHGERFTRVTLDAPENVLQTIVPGPDGGLWFTESTAIGRIDSDGVVTEFPLGETHAPVGLTTGPDGNLWFTEPPNDTIGRMTADGNLTRFTVPPGTAPAQITSGPDGALWFTAADAIGHMSSAGVFLGTFPLTGTLGGLGGIVAGPDGNLWFTEVYANRIGRITTSGVVTEFPVPTEDADPYGIVAGPDGNLWFNEFVRGRIGRITPSGAVTEFRLGRASAVEPWVTGIGVGPDGAIWYTKQDFSENAVGRLTTAGRVNEFPVADSSGFVAGITGGPDGNVWFVESGNASVWRVTGVVGIDPAVGPASGGGTAAVSVLGLVPGASVEIGGVPAGDVEMTDPTSLRVTIPALPPGTLNDVRVGVPNEPSSTLRAGWMADFADVPSDSPFHSAVAALFGEGVTSGCGAGDFCPDRAVTRAETAMLLLRAARGEALFLSPPDGHVFGDVPADLFAAAVIEQLFRDRITSGCGGGNFCPSSPVPRASVSVLLVRAKNGVQPPPDATGIFEDVSAEDPHARWIEQLAREEISRGCGGARFCPGALTTRGELAALLARAFQLRRR